MDLVPTCAGQTQMGSLCRQQTGLFSRCVLKTTRKGCKKTTHEQDVFLNILKNTKNEFALAGC